MNQTPNPNYKLIAGVILAVAALFAYVLLKAYQIDTGELMLFVGPLVTFLLIGSKVEQETQRQNEVLAKIDKQTNGVLRGIIKDVVNEALDERDEQGKSS